MSDEAVKAARRIEAQFDGRSVHTIDVGDIRLVARALLSREAERDAVIEQCAKVADEEARRRNEVSDKHYVHFLTVEQSFVLNEACRIVNEAFGDVSYGIFQVGSSLTKPNWRDVDVRCMVDPAHWERLFGSGDNGLALRFLNVAISVYLRERTGLPIDFQFQHAARANAEYPSGAKGPHKRNAVGLNP